MDFTARKQNIFSLVVCKEAEHLNVRHAKMQDEYSGIYDCAGVAPISFDLDMPQEVKIQFFGEHAAIRELVDMNRADGIWADLIYGYLCVLCGCLYMYHSLHNIFIVFFCFSMCTFFCYLRFYLPVFSEGYMLFSINPSEAGKCHIGKPGLGPGGP